MGGATVHCLHTGVGWGWWWSDQSHSHLLSKPLKVLHGSLSIKQFSSAKMPTLPLEVQHRSPPADDHAAVAPSRLSFCLLQWYRKVLPWKGKVGRTELCSRRADHQGSPSFKLGSSGQPFSCPNSPRAGSEVPTAMQAWCPGMNLAG